MALPAQVESGFKSRELLMWQQEVVDRRPPMNYQNEAREEYDKQFSLWYYWWMKEVGEVDDEVLLNILKADTVRWAAEHVFKVGYREFDFDYEGGQLRSRDFGGRTMLSMCAEAVELRAQAGVSTERVEHEGLGVYRLQGLMEKMKSGETAVIVSPPDATKEKQAKYNMIYVYEKRGDKLVKATAIRDEESSIADLRVLAGYLSGNMSSWKQAGDLEMVAVPFVTRLKFDELLSELGADLASEIPKWAQEMIDETIEEMWSEIMSGRREGAKELFDALQIALFNENMRRTDTDERIEVGIKFYPSQMVSSDEEWMEAQAYFLEFGGKEMMEEMYQCGAVSLDLKKLGEENNLMSSLMGVDESHPESTNGEKGEKQCYQCPVEGCGADVYKKGADVYCEKGHHKG